MSSFNNIILVYIAIISIISVILVIFDKIKAQKSEWRVRETTLFLFAVLGGSAFMYFTMCIVRHKTQKNQFVFGIPLIFILQCIAIYFLYLHFGV